MFKILTLMKSDGFIVVCYANQSTAFRPAQLFSHPEYYCQQGVGWKLISPLCIQFPLPYIQFPLPYT